MLRSHSFRKLIPSCLMLIVALGLPTAQASDCINWSNLPTPLADLETGGTVRALARSGDRLYVGTDDRLLIADLSGAVPSWLGELALPGDQLRDLAASGTTVIAAFGFYGAQIIEAADPAAPYVAGTLTDPCEAADFAGDLLCSFSYQGLALNDISVPTAPVLIGSHPQGLGGSMPRLVARPDACWVRTSGSLGSLRGYDLSDPSAPVIGGHVVPTLGLPNAAKPAGAVLEGDLLYLLVHQIGSDGTYEFFIDARLFAVDVSDPAAPAPLGQVVVSDEPATGLAMEGTLAAVGLSAKIQLVDLVDPNNPLLTPQHPALGPLNGPQELAGGRVFVGLSSLRVLDVSGPAVTPELGQHPLGGQTVSAPLVSGNHMFVGMSNMGYPGPGGYDDFRIAAYDCSDPLSPVYLRSMGGPWTSLITAVVGDFLYGEGIFDWTTGDAVPFAGPIPVASATPVGSNALYETGSGLTVWDVADPAAPAVAGTHLAGQSVRDVVSEGSLVAVVCDGSLVTMDAQFPLSPVVHTTTPLAGNFTHGSLADGWLALIGIDGFQLVDVRNPTAPIMGDFVAEPDLKDVDLQGNIAYAASGTAGTVAIACGLDGSAVVLGRHYADTHLFAGHAVMGASVYALYGGVWGYPGEGGTLYRLAPECSSTVPNLVSSFTMEWQGSVCRLALRLSRELTELRFVARSGLDEWIVPWHTDGYGIYVAEDTGWLDAPGRSVTYVAQTLDTGGAWIDLAQTRTDVPAVATALHDPVPNPFNPETRLSFDLAESGPVKLEVYGLDGKRVRTLIAGNLRAGPHDFVWDGLDDRDRPLSTGVYLIRLETTAKVVTRKAALIK
ncbi:MAG: FlgD immunoglobulin-like domain containing protein [Candidatus Krumholzibacteriota bacterium]